MSRGAGGHRGPQCITAGTDTGVLYLSGGEVSRPLSGVFGRVGCWTADRSEPQVSSCIQDAAKPYVSKPNQCCSCATNWPVFFSQLEGPPAAFSKGRMGRVGRRCG